MIANPWLSIWVQPRATIRAIVAENPKKCLWGLAFIAGLNSTLSFFQSIPIALSMGLIPMILMALVIAPFLGQVVFAFWSWLTLITGRMLKGAATFQTIRAAQAWACVPLLGSLAIWFFLVLGYSKIFFYESETVVPGAKANILVLFLIGKVGFAIWSLVLYISALAEVQQFSILRSIANLILAIVGFFVLWMVFGMILSTLIMGIR